MARRTIAHFLGDTPGRVIVRLLLLSLLVGILLEIFDVAPAEIIPDFLSFLRWLWVSFLHTLESAGGTLVLGAAIVLPLWLIIRLVALARGRG